MLVAQQKLKENIAEYILYMYQVEDIIRAYELNVDRLMNEFVIPQLNNPSLNDEYRKWYEGLVKQMILQRIEKQGHLHDLNEIMVELSYLHNVLINMANDTKYRDLFDRALPFINEFKEKSNLKDRNEIDLAFHAMYMKLLLKLKKQEISSATEEAFDSMRVLLAYIAKAYHRMKKGDLDFLQN